HMKLAHVPLGSPSLTWPGNGSRSGSKSNGHFLPKAVKRYRRPRGILISNPGCYAAPLRDCSKKLSGGHWLSKSLLRAVANARRQEWKSPGASCDGSGKSAASRSGKSAAPGRKEQAG